MSFPLLALVLRGFDTQKSPPTSEEMNEIFVECEIASFKLLSFGVEIDLDNDVVPLESFIEAFRLTADDIAIVVPFVESAGRAK